MNDTSRAFYQKGVTLIEIIIFIIVIGLGLAALVKVYSHASSKTVNPVVRQQVLRLVQAQLDEIMARRFDENTPTGGVPACNSADGVACLGIVPDVDFDDVGDFHGYVNNQDASHPLTVSVVEAGTELGLSDNSAARRITVTGVVTGGDRLSLSVYKVNF